LFCICSVTDDENDEEKRFINSAIAKQVLQFVTERVNDACDNPPEGKENKKTFSFGSVNDVKSKFTYSTSQSVL
jgi:hypothetical protein